MTDHESFLAKRNHDGSFSIAVRARDIAEVAWVDFYDDHRGQGYQRRETLRERRGRDIEEYFRRCASEGVRPRLFEMTGNVRSPEDGKPVAEFDPLDENGELGILTVESPDRQWLAMIDGGTRLLGIQRAVSSSAISGDTTFDVRVFTGLAVPEEIALFLLINEKQKRVRTDLGIRVVQRYLDEGTLSDQEKKTLSTVVPDTDTWKYEASRVGGRMNMDADSGWNGLIQMPGDTVTKPIKLQAFWTSLKHLLDDPDIKVRLKQIQAEGTLPSGDSTDFVVQVLKNLWAAVAEVNPDARAEPRTNVLWGSIGVNACHQALAGIMKTILSTDAPDFRLERFVEMIGESYIADFDYWFSRPGSLLSEYPGEKGEGTTMTGGSGYSRLASILEEQWRAALHAAGPSKVVTV